jgi:hypothetical protein
MLLPDYAGMQRILAAQSIAERCYQGIGEAG